MNYWLDTEFIEDGRTIDLISIGLVAEDGREYYAISTEFNSRKASAWVKEHVFPQLPPRCDFWKSREQIALDLLSFLKQATDLGCYERCPIQKLAAKLTRRTGLKHHPRKEVRDLFEDTSFGPPPQIWGYYADYDWVAFCQLFGTMMDLPKGFPMYCRDIKQWCDTLGNPRLPKQHEGVHDALEDARWNKKSWAFLANLSDLK